MTRTRTAVWIAVAVALFWLAGRVGNGVHLVPADRAPAATGLRLRDLRGRDLDLATFDGRVVLVNLWAGWCPPCRREIPRLNRLAAALGNDGLTVIGVNVEQLEPERLAALRDSLGIEYPVLVPSAPLPSALRWNGTLPHLFLVDRLGRLRSSHSGLPSARSLRRACERLLQEPGPGAQVPSSAATMPSPAIALGDPFSSSSGP